jgi:hypothetical protein
MGLRVGGRVGHATDGGHGRQLTIGELQPAGRPVRVDDQRRFRPSQTGCAPPVPQQRLQPGVVVGAAPVDVGQGIGVGDSGRADRQTAGPGGRRVLFGRRQGGGRLGGSTVVGQGVVVSEPPVEVRDPFDHLDGYAVGGVALVQSGDRPFGEPVPAVLRRGAHQFDLHHRKP